MNSGVVNLKRVLILSPHTDDAELGAGGTIARLLEEGKDIEYVVFSGCETSVPNGMPKDTLRKECKHAAELIGLATGQAKDHGLSGEDLSRTQAGNPRRHDQAETEAMLLTWCWCHHRMMCTRTTQPYTGRR